MARITADANGRPAPAPRGTGLTAVSATSPLVLSLNGSVLSGSIDLSAIPPKVAVEQEGAAVGTKPTINLIAGANVVLTISDDVPNNRINIQIDATGGVTGSGTEATLPRWAAGGSALEDSRISEVAGATLVGVSDPGSVSQTMVVADDGIGGPMRVYPQNTNGISTVVQTLQLEAQGANGSFLSLGPDDCSLKKPSSGITSYGSVTIDSNGAVVHGNEGVMPFVARSTHGMGTLTLEAQDAEGSSGVSMNGVGVVVTGVDVAIVCDRFGVFGADPVDKSTISGSRDGNAALASLLTALAALGLVTDSTTA